LVGQVRSTQRATVSCPLSRPPHKHTDGTEISIRPSKPEHFNNSLPHTARETTRLLVQRDVYTVSTKVLVRVSYKGSSTCLSPAQRSHTGLVQNFQLKSSLKVLLLAEHQPPLVLRHRSDTRTVFSVNSHVGVENIGIIGWRNASIIGWRNASIVGWRNASTIPLLYLNTNNVVFSLSLGH
jgi:hypothetical protein